MAKIAALMDLADYYKLRMCFYNVKVAARDLCFLRVGSIC